MELLTLENNVTTHLADISNDAAHFGADPSLSDNTSFIQNALDKCGIVTIKKAGDYYVKTLYIGSDTTFVLGNGVRLVLKDNTSNFLFKK